MARINFLPLHNEKYTLADARVGRRAGYKVHVISLVSVYVSYSWRLNGPGCQNI